MTQVMTLSIVLLFLFGLPAKVELSCEETVHINETAVY